LAAAHTVVPPVKAKTDSSVRSSGHGQNLTSNSVDAGFMSIHSCKSVGESSILLATSSGDWRDVRLGRVNLILTSTYTELRAPLE
jgi:hypothetical protein